MIARLLLFLLVLGGAPAFAHEIRPAFLHVREIEPATYDVLWKTPAQGDMRLALNVVLPETCADVGEPRTTLIGGAVIARWRTACAGGLVGKELFVENLGQTLTDAIVRFEPLERSPVTLRFTPDKPGGVIPGEQAWTEVAGSYFVLGVEHILLGFDHLMFVLALLILVREPKRLIGAVTAFTVAHSITLAGTTFGWIKLPSAPVEATIALSIVFVALEIFRSRAGQASLTAQLPWVASLAFGLLHGFGFAGALREIGIPEEAAPLALLFFNLGVEAGQLVFIAAVLAVIAAWRWAKLPANEWAWRAPVYVIGATAGFWFIERTAGILGF